MFRALVRYERCSVCSSMPLPSKTRCLMHLEYQRLASKKSRLANPLFNDLRRERYRTDEAFRERLKQNRKKDPVRDRRGNLRRHGMTVGQWETLYLFQGQRCALCFSDKPGGRGNLHVDHDHRSGGIRGLLCHWCNTALPRIEIDGWAERAVAYVGVTFI